MSIHDLYSNRNKKPVDVFTYDVLPEKLKVQIVHLWTNFFDQFNEDYRGEIWEAIHSILSEEFGKKTLLADDVRSFYDSYRVEFYFEKKATLNECLDIIETVFRFIRKVKEFYQQRNYHELRLYYEPEQVVKDLNTRFLENAVGFALEQGRIIRLDNELLHKEVTIPALNLLNSITFKNANDEFLSAYEHFRFNVSHRAAHLSHTFLCFYLRLKVIYVEVQSAAVFRPYHSVAAEWFISKGLV